MLYTVLMILIILFLPRLMQYLAEHVKPLGKFGTVFLCYAAGLLLSFPLKALGADMGLASDFSSVLVCIAMPLILFSADLPAVRRLAKPVLVSFGLNVAAVLVMATAAFAIFRGRISGAAEISAMLVGTYTGGTPNMFAIGNGLGASPELILFTQTSDMIGGGLYFFALVSFLPGLLARFLPAYRFSGREDKKLTGELESEYSAEKLSVKPWVAFWRRCRIVMLAVACVAAAMGFCILLPSKYGNTGLAKLSEYTAVMMLLVTTFGIALSFVKKIRTAPGSYASGQYFILMFSMAMGLCFDITAVSGILLLLVMLLLIQFGTAALHYLLARLVHIDRDTAMITSTAGIFGPAFIMPVANKLGNDEIVLPGILCGILGYAVGNYLGIGVGMLLRLV